MNKIYAVTLLLLLVACSDDDKSAPLVPAKNTVVAQRNNNYWSGTAELTLDSTTDTLVVLGIGDEEVIHLKVKFNGVGTYTLKNNQAGFYTTIGQDVITSQYSLVNNATGKLVITKYNEIGKEVEGTFSVSLTKTMGDTNINVYNFARGAFNGKIMD